jgi:hypothetical protein
VSETTNQTEAIGLTPQQRQVRGSVYENLIRVRPDLKKAMSKCDRTMARWVREGLPIVIIGKTEYAILPDAITWIRNRRRKAPLAPLPRTPGRPRKVNP